MARKLIAWDDNQDRIVRTTVDPDSITTGLQLDKVLAGSTVIPNGATSVVCNFGDTFSGLFVVGIQMTNIVDSSSLIQVPNITAKTAGSATVEWNMPVDSANYRMDFIALEPCLQYRANEGSFSPNDLSDVINLPTASTLGVTVSNEYSNFPATDPQTFHPLLITAKSASDLTVSRPTTDTTEIYILHTLASNVSCTNLQAGTSTIGSGVDDITVSFPFPRLDTTSYAVSITLENTVDSEPLYILPTVYAKATTLFRVKLSHPTDSANYILNWICQAF